MDWAALLPGHASHQAPWVATPLVAGAGPAAPPPPAPQIPAPPLLTEEFMLTAFKVRGGWRAGRAGQL